MWTVIFCMVFNGGAIPWYLCMKNYGMMDKVWGLALRGSLPVYSVTPNFFRNLQRRTCLILSFAPLRMTAEGGARTQAGFLFFLRDYND